MYGGLIMTKKELVKWLEIKGKDAEIQAEKDRLARIANAKEIEYKDIGLDEFIDSVDSIMQKFLSVYEEFIDKVNSKSIEGTGMSRYGWHYGYNDMLDRYGDKKRIREEISKLIRTDTKRFNAERDAANEYKRNVVHTYNTVIETVKNLPTAKDGIEYLKKLGFDISEIEPVEKKKQLPATINVNVDVKYLLLNKEKEDDRTGTVIKADR